MRFSPVWVTMAALFCSLLTLPCAAYEELMVYVDGRVDADDIESRVCSLTIVTTQCARFRVFSINYVDDYTVADVEVMVGTPPADVVADSVLNAKLITRPSGIFRIDRIQVPEATTPPLISEEDKLIYAAAAAFVGGALLVCLAVYCVHRRRRSQTSLPGAAPSSHLRGDLQVDATLSTMPSEQAELRAKVQHLEVLTQRLLNAQDTQTAYRQAAADMEDEYFEPAALKADEAVAALEAAEKSKASSWWHAQPSERKGAPELLRDPADSHRGTLHQGLLFSSLSARVPPEHSRHWHLAKDFPRLPNSIAGLVHVAGSRLHGLGVFAAQFISPGVILFSYLNPSRLHDASLRFTMAQAALQFGYGFQDRLHFAICDPARDLCVVAEDPSARGWGCLLNSAHSEIDLEANCEIIWCGTTPYVRSKSYIPPLAELLLDYAFPPPSS
jgi:hypothetical protein